jgi:methyl-accepting chemotaxis protein
MKSAQLTQLIEEAWWLRHQYAEETLFKEAEAFAARDDLESLLNAIKVFDKVLALDATGPQAKEKAKKRQAEVHLKAAETCEKKQDYAGAVSHYDSAIGASALDGKDLFGALLSNAGAWAKRSEYYTAGEFMDMAIKCTFRQFTSPAAELSAHADRARYFRKAGDTTRLKESYTEFTTSYVAILGTNEQERVSPEAHLEAARGFRFLGNLVGADSAISYALLKGPSKEAADELHALSKAVRTHECLKLQPQTASFMVPDDAQSVVDAFCAACCFPETHREKFIELYRKTRLTSAMRVRWRRLAFELKGNIDPELYRQLEFETAFGSQTFGLRALNKFWRIEDLGAKVLIGGALVVFSSIIPTGIRMYLDQKAAHQGALREKATVAQKLGDTEKNLKEAEELIRLLRQNDVNDKYAQALSDLKVLREQIAKEQNEVKQYKDKLAQANKNENELSSQLEAAVKRASEYDAQVREVSKKNEQIARNLEETAARCAKGDELIKTLQGEMQNSKKELAEFRNLYDVSKKTVEALDKEIADKERMLEEFRKRGDLSDLVKKLEEENKAHQQKIKELEAKLGQNSQKLPDIPSEAIILAVTGKNEILDNFTFRPGNTYQFWLKRDADIARLALYTSEGKIRGRIDYKDDALRDEDVELKGDVNGFVEKFKKIRADVAAVRQKIRDKTFGITDTENALDEMLKTLPNDTEVLAVYAMYWDRRGERPKENAILIRILEIDPTHATANYWRALNIQEEEPVRARGHYETALRSASTEYRKTVQADYDKFLKKGDELLNDPWLDGGKGFVQDSKIAKALLIKGETLETLLRVGEIYAEANNRNKHLEDNFKKAEQYFQQALAKAADRPSKGSIEHRLGQLYEKKERLPSAAMRYINAVKCEPSNLEFTNSLTLFYMNNKTKFDESTLKAVEKALAEVKRDK